MRSEKYQLYFYLAAAGVLFILIAVFSKGTYDSGDGIQHYLISRYSWKHPELFLHLWGKPFFTLVSSPFTQFGLIGAHLFNILCALGSAYLCYRIAQKLEMKNALYTLVFLFFAPIYFAVIQSGLTEPFFGLVLIFSIFLFIEKHFLISALTISFLPFVRSEGYLILPLFFIMLCYRRKFKHIPLLCAGTAIYTVLGYFHFGDILWLVHQNPYKGASLIYGKGSFFHFFIRAEFIWGLPLFILFITGCWQLVKTINNQRIGLKIPVNSFLAEELILIFGSFFIYFFAHVIFWWQGIFSSLGLIRVIAAVMPLSALISIKGFNLIQLYFINSKKNFAKFKIVLFSGLVLFCSIHNYSITGLNKENAVVKNATDWIKEAKLTDRKVFYLHPFITIELDLDRFDDKTNGELWGLPADNPENAMPSGSLLIWDAHFGPNEGRIKLEILRNNPSFRLMATFLPEKEFNVLGGNKFEVYIFERK